MNLFYCVMNGIQQFAANLLSYIPAKYYYNWSTSDLVIVKTKRVNFFETQCTKALKAIMQTKLQLYRVAQIKRCHFTYLLVTNECIYTIL